MNWALVRGGVCAPAHLGQCDGVGENDVGWVDVRLGVEQFDF
jgi:hypothetical protein